MTQSYSGKIVVTILSLAVLVRSDFVTMDTAVSAADEAVSEVFCWLPQPEKQNIVIRNARKSDKYFFIRKTSV